MACLLCQKEQVRILRCGIREDATRPVFICSHCRLQFIDPPAGNLRDYYRNGYRKTHDAVPSKAITPEERFTIGQVHTLTSSRMFMEHVPEGTSVLEIGCSSGGFLSHLVGKYELYGNEWNPEDAAYVREVGEIPCEEGDITEVFPGKSFGAIIVCAVLEHVANPLEWLIQLKNRLIGGGFLYLETPNATDALLTVYDLPAYRDFWYREPHITYWSADILASLMTSAGIEARVTYYQRYGLRNHMYWLEHGKPMTDPIAAREYYKPIHPKHPVGPYGNRQWVTMDRNYRLWLECILAADTLKCIGRRREI
jgi:SAM-dependent methyltransferase